MPIYLNVMAPHGKEIMVSSFFKHLFIYLSILIFGLFPDVFHTYKERKEEEGEKVKHEENSQKCPFRHTYFFLKKKKKKPAHPHFGAWSTFGSHLVRGPKALKIAFNKESDHGSVTMKREHGKTPFDMGQFMVHDVNKRDFWA
jgi:hypothetical protein